MKELRRKTILIVDDALSNIRVLHKSLEQDYNILFATSGAEALEIISSSPAIDLILLDILMPGMDGYEVCKRIKLNDQANSIPIIFITSINDEESESKGLSLGAVDYITKPFRLGIVRSRVQSVLRLKDVMDQQVKLTSQLEDLNKTLEMRVDEKIALLSKAHEDLKKSEKKYRTIFENAIEGIFQTTPNGSFLDVNPSCAKILGYDSPEDLMSLISDIETQCYVDSNDRRKLISLISQNDIVNSFEAQFYRKDGSIIWGSISIRSIFDEHGKINCLEGFFIDITQQKDMESQLRQAQKMEAIGNLAGGIAHDFNNILSAIIGYTELSIGSIEKDSELNNYLSQVLKAGVRAKSLVKQILTFSRQTEQKFTVIRLKSIVQESLKLLQATLPTTIDIQQDIQSSSVIMGDNTQIHQLIMNLCTNAAHAMQEKGGILKIQLTDVDVRQKVLNKHGELEPGKYIHLLVSDTGCGMSPDLQERIFDPFFTTKSKGEGTGLGLSVVHGIVKSHSGTISVYSEVGKGASFKIYFPIIEHKLVPEVEKKSDLLTGNETILWIDDEEALVNIGKHILESLGYKVITQTSSIDALELFKEKFDMIDLVITDMTMPNMTGDQLALAMMDIKPDIPIILSTGFSSIIDEQRAFAIGIKSFISKPIFKQEIASTIRHVLDENQKTDFLANQGDNIYDDYATDNFQIDNFQIDHEMGIKNPLKILVAEDNLVNQKLVANMLKNIGYSIDIAGNGLEVIKYLEKNRYDIVFMDMHMPKMNGLETVDYIHANFSSELKPKIVAMTGDVLDKQEYISKGINGYISKPISIKNIIQSLKNIFNIN